VPAYRTRRVVSILSERPGIQRVLLDDDQRAYAITQLTGTVAEGDDVVVNTTAVDLGLGTGGWHVVHWNLSRSELDQPGGGHIMKLRYTSLQADTGAAEERHPDIPSTLDGIPVVVCSLHSQMGVVAAAFAAEAAAQRRRLAYVMTDGAALPIALSDLVHDLRAKDLLCGTVTAGHAFGGDCEAVNIPSALIIARHVLRADAIVVSMGPGVVGTGTALGTTALEIGPALDAAAALGGTAILCARASDGDARERHRGISHHTRTAVTLLAGRPFVMAVPASDGDLARQLRHPQAETQAVGVPDPAAMLDGLGLRVTTMGRGPLEDPLFFRFAAAAGVVAARRLRA
jgi:hypothetical protein